jgi:ElaB/YqjD/DUF883 family membrane-anchored ribosome-binding protein
MNHKEKLMETAGANDAMASGRRLGGEAAEAAGNIKNVASAEVKNLIADVEDLLARIADLKDADVSRVRNRVMQAVGKAKDTIAENAENLRRQAREAVTATDDFVHDSPWQAVGIAALVGALVGILVTRRS